MSEYNKTCFDDLSIAVPIFEGAEEQDVVGPFEMFFWMSLFEALPPDRALVATGSPFTPVEYGDRSIAIAQCNNVFIFPAVGLGLVASRARRVTDQMMLAGAKALGEQSPALRDPSASLLPNVGTIRAVALEVAYGVAQKAQEGFGG